MRAGVSCVRARAARAPGPVPPLPYALRALPIPVKGNGCALRALRAPRQNAYRAHAGQP